MAEVTMRQEKGLAKAEPMHLSLDASLAADIANAVKRAMKETFNVNAVPGEYEIGEGMVSLVGDVSGVIGMVQTRLEGTLALCLTFETVRDLLPQVIGKSISVTHEMAVD